MVNNLNIEHSMSESPIVSFEQVDFSYNSAPILSDVNLSIQAGELVYIVGPNGGGKTTLLKLMLGLLRPKNGIIKVFDLPPEKASSRIGYIPQFILFDPQFPITVLEVALMGRLKNSRIGTYSSADKKCALEALEKLQIADLARRPFAQLSGGQRQRTLIARALVSSPELLLLDEPTANVDAHTEDRLMNLIDELNQKYTVILVSHDVNFVSSKVKRVVCVNKTVQVHPTSEISGEAIRQLYTKNMLLVRHDMRISKES